MTPQMQQACISAAAAVVPVAAVVSSVSESVEPPRLRPVCSALLCSTLNNHSRNVSSLSALLGPPSEAGC